MVGNAQTAFPKSLSCLMLPCDEVFRCMYALYVLYVCNVCVVCMYVCMYACLYACMYLCMYVCVLVHRFTVISDKWHCGGLQAPVHNWCPHRLILSDTTTRMMHPAQRTRCGQLALSAARRCRAHNLRKIFQLCLAPSLSPAQRIQCIHTHTMHTYNEYSLSPAVLPIRYLRTSLAQLFVSPGRRSFCLPSPLVDPIAENLSCGS